jgi:phytoene dehydrogenase-like protein
MNDIPSRCDVVVIGAGLSGLAAAGRLARSGADVVLAEAGDAVGGRVRTDSVGGFLLDRGFQVLNTAYPQVKALLDLDALNLWPFQRALALYTDGRLVRLGDPRRDWRALPEALRAPVGGLLGRASLGAYATISAFAPARDLLARADEPALTAWRRRGLTEPVIEKVLRPFFAGLTLDAQATTSSRFTDLMLRMFVRGDSALPDAGMQAVPEQLARRLPRHVLHLHTTAVQAAAGHVVTDRGTIQARAVVVATDADAAARLLPGLRTPPWKGLTTWYHAVDGEPPAGPTLLVDAEPSPVVNTLPVTQAAASYGPPGRTLVATTALHAGTRGARQAVSEADVRHRLAMLYATGTDGWEHVATYHVPHALPSMAAPHPFRRPVSVDDVFVCGDHRATSSVQGALDSGERVAAAVLDRLRLKPARTAGTPEHEAV